MRQFWVYIVASRSGVLYVGMTNDIERRMYEHQHKLVPGFTAKYKTTLLMWYDSFPTAIQAIEAEKRIKGWSRAKKVRLIEDSNPTWRDLSEDFTVPPTLESTPPQSQALQCHSERTREESRNGSSLGSRDSSRVRSE